MMNCNSRSVVLSRDLPRAFPSASERGSLAAFWAWRAYRLFGYFRRNGFSREASKSSGSAKKRRLPWREMGSFDSPWAMRGTKGREQNAKWTWANFWATRCEKRAHCASRTSPCVGCGGNVGYSIQGSSSVGLLCPLAPNKVITENYSVRSASVALMLHSKLQCFPNRRSITWFIINSSTCQAPSLPLIVIK